MSYDHLMIAGQAVFLLVISVFFIALASCHFSPAPVTSCPPCEEISIIQRLHYACDAVLAESDGIDNDAPEVRGCFTIKGDK